MEPTGRPQKACAEYLAFTVLGRRPKLTVHQKRDALERRARGDACGNRPQLQRQRLDDFEAPRSSAVK